MNDKQQARWDEVREAYAKYLYHRAVPSFLIPWHRQPSPEVKRLYRDESRQLLNLKDSKGYLIEIADVDQYLGITLTGDLSRSDLANVHRAVKGWVKCLPRDKG